MVELRILGPLDVRVDGRAVTLGGVKPRAVVAVLALHANRPVSAERLAVALWGEEAPPSAVKTVQVYVARLRKALGEPDLLATTNGGYCLRLPPGELDLERFQRLVAAGREALAAGRAKRAAEQLSEALGLWRGPPLAELASLPFAPAEIARLEELQVAAVEVRVDADLTAGRHAELVGELRQLTRRHPWRERLHAQLMLALYRGGRQAEALEAYLHAREVLVEELGVEPGGELNDLHRAILAHDPAIDAPPAPAAPAEVHALPAPPNRTLGRAREIAAVGERLASGSTRLLTLTGPGGVGKTRLALEVARAVAPSFGDGARFVPLAALQSAEEVPAAILRALGIVSVAGEPAERAVERFLAGRHLLLVADNFEHVLGAAPFIAGLVDTCPALAVLVTSRERLALQAEQRHPVAPLALPGIGMAREPETLAAVAAVALFAERARAHDPAFALDAGNASAVGEICRRLDGLPLAIELAAARAGLLSPAEIAHRLHSVLGALGSGPRDAPARQQTLRATVDWSYELLTEDERACFERLGVFAGAPTVEAAETVTGARLDTLDSLVAKSLLVRRGLPGAPTRLAMLETIRAYAIERFASSAEPEAVLERHRRYHLELAERHGSDRALWGSGHRAHLAELDASIDDLHGALERALRDGAAEPALELCAALGWYWLARNRHAEAAAWAARALSVPGAGAHPALCVRVRCVMASGLWALGRRAELEEAMLAAETAARAHADPALLSHALEVRAVFEADAGRFESADALADEAFELARAAGDEWAVAMAARASAMAAADPAQLRERVARATELLARAGNLFHLAGLLASSAYTALGAGSLQEASELAGRADAVARELDHPHLSMLVGGNVALTALLTGDVDGARDAFREELRVSRELAFRPFVAEGLQGLAAVAAVRGDLGRAARLCGAAVAHRVHEGADPVGARLDATFFAPARARAGAEAWDAGRREGAGWSFAEAIAYALDGPGA